MPENGWETWGKHVLAEQQRQGASLETFRKEVGDQFQSLSQEIATFKLDMTREVTALKVKSGAWGAVAGAMTGFVAWIAGGR